MNYQAVMLKDGTLLHVGDDFPACPTSEELWTVERIFYDYNQTKLIVLEFAFKEGGIMTRHYPLSSIEFLGGCSKTEAF